MSNLLYTWEDFGRDIKLLAERIDKVESPDYLFGIHRGGVLIAGALGILLNVPAVSYFDPRKSDPPPSVDLEPGSNIILVDDVSDSGNTFRRLSLLCQSHYSVVTCAIHYKPLSVYEPTYYQSITKDWIVYPWEKWYDKDKQ